MKKTVVIHQPDFLPYLGFFHRLLYADLFIVLDDVQFVKKGGWHHRDKIKTNKGESWITLCVKKTTLKTNIKDVLLSGDSWKDKHFNLIRQNYRKASFFNEVFPFFENVYNQSYEMLIDINMAFIKLLLNLFKINIKIQFSSSYNVNSVSNQRLVDLLARVNATHYLSGVGARDYFDSMPYEDADIKVIWQDFKHPVYPQLHGEFLPYLSSIDLLFNCGIEKSREILRSI